MLQQKLAGKHKRFVCYKRGKFKGTGEAGKNTFASLFNVSPRRGLNKGRVDLNDLLTSKRGIIFTAHI